MDKTQFLSSLKNQGFSSQILRAFEKVPRENFVPEKLESFAYEDTALPIGKAQTISQPYIVALMTQTLYLTGKEKVLEIGTGSGYQTAMLAELAGKIYTVDIFVTKRIKHFFCFF